MTSRNGHGDWRKTFAKREDAEAFLAASGFSVGRLQDPAPRGILFGDYDIQKWRNLRREDIVALHGMMTGSRLAEHYVITIWDRAPSEAHAAINRHAESTLASGLGESEAA